MQGQIIRVKGTFSRGNLPKLSEFDTSFILQEILNHESCRHFYDLTDITKLTLDSGKIIAANDLKGGNPLTATLAQAPLYNADIFGGRGGAVFNGAQRMTAAAGLFTTGVTTSVNCSFQCNLASTANQFILIPTVGTSGGSLYYNGNQIRSFSAGLTKTVDSVFKRLNVSNVYKPDYFYKTVIGTEVLAMTSAGQSFHMTTSASVLNVGSTAVPDLYANMNLGHIAIFETDIATDSYLLALVNEFHKRQYNI